MIDLKALLVFFTIQETINALNPWHHLLSALVYLQPLSPQLGTVVSHPKFQSDVSFHGRPWAQTSGVGGRLATFQTGCDLLLLSSLLCLSIHCLWDLKSYCDQYPSQEPRDPQVAVPNWDTGKGMWFCLPPVLTQHVPASLKRVWSLLPDPASWWTTPIPCLKRLLLPLLSRFSRVQLCATPQTAAHQAPLSLGFSRQGHWSGLPFPSPKAHFCKCQLACLLSDCSVLGTILGPGETGFLLHLEVGINDWILFLVTKGREITYIFKP